MFVVLLREGKLASYSLYAFASCITSLYLLAVSISSELISLSVHLLSLKATRREGGGNLKAATKLCVLCFTAVMFRPYDAQLLLFRIYLFIAILYMFRAPLCSSSGESIVLIRHLVYVTVCRWPSGVHTRRSPIYLLTPWSRVLLEKLTSKLCS